MDQDQDQDQDQDKIQHSPFLLAAGAYCAVLCIGILGGFFLPAEENYYSGNAAEMPAASVLIALFLGGAAAGLFLRMNAARFVFFAAAPWGALGLAASFPHALWMEDIPYTILLAPVYAVFVFLASRRSVLQAVGSDKEGWIARGAAFLLVCVIIMGVARLVVGASPPSGGGGLYGQMSNMNDYVQHMVICDVPLWHYVAGFIAAMIPWRAAKVESAV